MAAAAQVGVLALCDHDCIDGITEARSAGADVGVTIISGVEFSCVWESGRHVYADIHVLGYGFDPDQEDLRGALHEFQQFRATRNQRIVADVNALLQRQGHSEISFDRVRQRAGGSIGRPHIAMELIAQGVVADVEEAFRRYLVRCNVEKRFFPIHEAIDLIHAAGGVAVLAHPPYITSDRLQMQEMLDVFTSMGMQGIEVYNNAASVADVQWYLSQARHRGLIATGGSDFHGIEEGGAEFGRVRACGDIPRSCYTQLQQLIL